ncbi:YegS/Rv2252/BmrU family lipid kinase [Kribbella sandramycini]|uniref:Diacylglycerol kinase (ATP) n=1 Tax=Kribbella sandramycini TaxID=60450 RepID=A0A7Y4P2H6_9ACTN|nr:YegS/Rv2252/BmrU family lipid kinase [Kribbella sandramycini]MBB6570912.1 diacylglycerol kinase (ATP) [Kribbella sandramycini]NOL44043.1 YegS/Rv2252/BmrU family lipid kinase [Kribbella sandramycini]
MTRRIALVVNPTSGKGLGARVAPVVRARLESAGLSVDTYETTCAEDVGRISADVIGSGADAVTLVGGDGTIHLGAQVLAKSGMPFGVVPAGTGNDFARGVGIPLKDPAAAADLIIAGNTRSVDLAVAEGEFITTVVAGGFDSLVNKRANAMSWPKGNSRYTVATLAELRTFSPLEYIVTVDGEVIETKAMLVAVGTGPTYGGGLQICAGAEIDDGVLDVTIIEPVSRLTLLQLFPKLSKGTHVGHPAVRALRGRSVRIESPGITAYADGEPLGPLPVDVTIAPGALTVFA